MKENKKKIVFGAISLLISAILQAVFSCYLQNNWIVLAFSCIYAIIFLKFIKDEYVLNWLIAGRNKNTLKAIGIIVLFIGIALLPHSLEQPLDPIVEFVAHMASYICWMIGLLLIDVANEQ